MMILVKCRATKMFLLLQLFVFVLTTKYQCFGFQCTTTTTNFAQRRICRPQINQPNQYELISLRLKEQKQDNEQVSDVVTKDVIESSDSIKSTQLTETEEEAKYPIDLPSPILLATSMVLAIASTGSLFNLFNGETEKLNFATTAAIAIIGLPLCLFLLFAAIKKAQIETEEDDKEFLNNNNKNKNRWG